MPFLAFLFTFLGGGEGLDRFIYDQTIWEISSHELAFQHPDFVTRCEDSIFALYKKDGFIVQFDTSGKLLNHFGGIGSGPGEINRGVLNMSCSDQSLLVFHPNQRIDYFHKNGAFSTSERGNYLNGNYILFKDGDTEIYLTRQGADTQVLWTISGEEYLKEEMVGSDSKDEITELRALKQGPFMFIYNAFSNLGQNHFMVFNLDQGSVSGKGSFTSTAYEILKPQPPKGAAPDSIYYYSVTSGVTQSEELGFTLTNFTRGKLTNSANVRYEVLDIYHPQNREWSKMSIATPDPHKFTFFQHIKGNQWAAFDVIKGTIVSFSIREAN